MSNKRAEGAKGGLPPEKEGQNIDLTIAHWCVFGPRVSGMYETVREIIAAENRIEGVLAGFVETPDPKGSQAMINQAIEGGKPDAMFPELRTQEWGWAQKWANIHVIHTTIPKQVGELKPKAFYCHGCFHMNSRIRMADGSMRRIRDIRIGEEVPSRNRETGKIENKPVTDIGPNGDYDDWFRVIPDEGPHLICTRDHPFDTTNGKIPADQLAPGMRVLSCDISFSQIQREIIFGANLGDAYVDPNGLSTCHRNRDYNSQIARFFEGFNIWRRDYPTGFSGWVERLVIGLRRDQVPRSEKKVSYDRSPFRDVYRLCTKNGKKKLTEGWLNGLGWTSLAILYLDDGSLAAHSYTKKNGEISHYFPSISIAICNLSESDALRLAEALRDRFGLAAEVYNHDYPRIYISKEEDARKFFQGITDAFPIPDSMRYKIPVDYLNKKVVSSDSIHWKESTVLIKDVIPLKGSKRWGRSKRWAMTVADNHNYFAGLCQVENTPEACMTQDLEKNVESFMPAADWINRCEVSFCTSHRALECWSPFDYTGKKLHLIQKGIDLDWWVRSPTTQDIDGEPSVLYGDIWRDMKTPFHLIYAVNELYKRNPKVRLNPWGLNMGKEFWRGMVHQGRFDKFIGKRGLRGIVDYPAQWYSRGDVLMSPGIYGDLARVGQESMACGCPVIGWDVDPYDDQHAFRYAKAFSIQDLADTIEEVCGEVKDDPDGVKKLCREKAEKWFDINKTAAQMVEVLRETVSNQ